MNTKFLSLGATLLVVVGLSSGCSQSKEIEALKTQVQDLQAKVAAADQAAREAQRTASQAESAANDARTTAGQAVQRADAAAQLALNVKDQVAASRKPAAPAKATKTTAKKKSH